MLGLRNLIYKLHEATVDDPTRRGPTGWFVCVGGRIRDFLPRGNVLVLGLVVEFLRRVTVICFGDLDPKTRYRRRPSCYLSFRCFFLYRVFDICSSWVAGWVRTMLVLLETGLGDTIILLICRWILIRRQVSFQPLNDGFAKLNL